MKVLVTEEQYGFYTRSRYDCMKEYIDQLKSDEEKLPVPPSSLKWDTYKYLFTGMLRKHCGFGNSQFFDEVIHNDIMELFGDDLFKIYEDNK